MFWMVGVPEKYCSCRKKCRDDGWVGMDNRKLNITNEIIYLHYVEFCPQVYF